MIDEAIKSGTPLVFTANEDDREPFGTPLFWTYAGLATCKRNSNFTLIVCTLFAGMMSGLTVGFMSIDKLDLELKLCSGTPSEKRAVNNPSIILHFRLKLSSRS